MLSLKAMVKLRFINTKLHKTNVQVSYHLRQNIFHRVEKKPFLARYRYFPTYLYKRKYSFLPALKISKSLYSSSGQFDLNYCDISPQSKGQILLEWTTRFYLRTIIFSLVPLALGDVWFVFFLAKDNIYRSHCSLTHRMHRIY